MLLTKPSFTVATIIDVPTGADRSATKPLLVRAVGTSLSQFGVTEALPDPKLTLFQDTTTYSSNDNWSAALTGVFTAAGAFSLTSSLDAAAYSAATPVGKYSVVASSADSRTGNVLAEIYDLDP